MKLYNVCQIVYMPTSGGFYHVRFKSIDLICAYSVDAALHEAKRRGHRVPILESGQEKAK